MTTWFGMKNGRRARIVSTSMARQARHPQNVRVIVATCMGLVVLISVTLGWLGWRLLMQEEALQTQQAKSGIEQSADAALAAFLRRVAETEAWLNRIGQALPDAATAAGQPAAGAILVVFSQSGIEVQPSGSLLYSPVPPLPDSFDPALFAPAARLEFQASDLNTARAALGTLTENKDPAVRAEALLRLARVQAKRGERKEALATYSKLTNENRVSLADASYALLSRFARCELLLSSNQQALASGEAAALIEALDSGTWRISKESYAWYDSRARKIAGPDAPAHAPAVKLAFAATVETAWDAWQLFQRSGSRSLTTHLHSSGEAPVLTFLNANPERMISIMYSGDALGMLLNPQARDASAPRVSLSDEHGQLIFGMEEGGSRLRASRSLAAAGLPWQLCGRGERRFPSVSGGAAELSDPRSGHRPRYRLARLLRDGARRPSRSGCRPATVRLRVGRVARIPKSADDAPSAHRTAVRRADSR